MSYSSQEKVREAAEKVEKSQSGKNAPETSASSEPASAEPPEADSASPEEA